MEDQTLQTASSAEETTTNQHVKPNRQEHRQAYGTAKTENLRTSNFWRILQPAIVLIFATALFIVPLLILIPLLSNSLQALNTPNQAEAQLLWVWITMIVLELALCTTIACWIFKTFFSQQESYHH
jgi:type II secretory pathway component PulF